MIGRGLHRWIFSGLFLVVFVILGCEKNIPEPGNVPELRNLTFEESALIEQSNKTAFDLLSILNDKEPDKNVIFSPLSVGMAFGMINNGINSSGADPFNTGFTGSNVQINKAFNELSGLLRKIDKKVDISLSNSFWYHRKYVMDDLFKDKIMAYFDADAEGVNFESAHTSAYINRVVSAKVNKDIEKVNYQVPNHYETLQINAISFSGKWAFDPEVIVNGKSFNGNGGAKYEFIRNAIIRLYQDENKQIIDVPYGNGHYSMTIIMPGETADWQFSFDDFQKDLAKADTARFNLYLPVMEAQYQFNLKDLVSFYETALPIKPDYIFLGNAPNKIDAIMQGAYLGPPLSQNLIPSVWEENSTVSERAIKVDKPFLYFVREKHTGIILFAGRFLYPGT
jgi:serine protease inhibitor